MVISCAFVKLSSHSLEMFEWINQEDGAGITREDIQRRMRSHVTRSQNQRQNEEASRKGASAMLNELIHY